MKKKIISMITLAAFALTLVPMAAFAGTNVVEPTQSTISIDEATATVEQEVGKANVVLDLKDVKGEAAQAEANKMLIWAEDAEGNVARGVHYYDKDGNELPSNFKLENGHALNDTVNGFSNEDALQVSFDGVGTYTIKAGIYMEDGNATPLPTDPKELKRFNRTKLIKLGNVADKSTVAVTNHPVKVTAIDFAAPVKNKDNTMTWVKAKNGAATETIPMTVVGASDIAPDKTPVKVTSDCAGIKILDADKIALKGKKAEFKVSVDSTVTAGKYMIKVAIGDYSEDIILTIKGIPVKAESIEAVESEYKLNTVDALNGQLKELAQFIIKDNQGNVIETLTNEPAAKIGVTKVNGVACNHTDYVKVVKQPTGSKLTADDFVLAVGDKKAYLQSKKANLEKGDYEVEVILYNGEKATVKFTVAEFDKAEELVILTNGDEIAVPVNGAGVLAYTVKAVDKNNVVKAVKVTGQAIKPVSDEFVDKLELASDGKKIGVRAMRDYKNADILGAKIELTVKADNIIGSKEFTVVAKATDNDYKLVVDPVKGVAKKVNDANVTIVNKDKATDTKKVKELFVKVVDQSDKDAKVTVQKNGTKGIKVYSDKNTTVDIQIVAITSDINNNNIINTDLVYADTITYTVGDEELAPEDKTVVAMTIDSDNMIVNNKVVKMDVKPFVNKDWRTMVPFRALTEAFNAEVEWNEKDRTVTYTAGEDEIVLTIDSDKIVVNGKEKTMDTKAVIIDNRTFVPVRFVAEELGYTVTPIYDANGHTSDVVFQN